jgi:hypothetical protein
MQPPKFQNTFLVIIIHDIFLTNDRGIQETNQQRKRTEKNKSRKRTEKTYLKTRKIT